MTALRESSGQAVSRFAPSPTGALHLGHALSAIAAHDAVMPGGRFLLRMEDLDTGRVRDGADNAIVADLAWLGLSWSPPILVQSTRREAYGAALARLGAAGLIYPCICSRAEIAASVAAPHGPAGPVYPGTCRRDPPRRDDSRPRAWRLDMARAMAVAGPCDWIDADAGTVRGDPAMWGDAVLMRRDGAAAYALACLVDDAYQGVTTVVRGRDLFDATHLQRLLQVLLDLPSPTYRHHALVCDANGQRLAKRHDAAALAHWRDSGMDGGALAAAIRCGELPSGFRLDHP